MSNIIFKKEGNTSINNIFCKINDYSNSTNNDNNNNNNNNNNQNILPIGSFIPPTSTSTSTPSTSSSLSKSLIENEKRLEKENLAKQNRLSKVRKVQNIS